MNTVQEDDQELDFTDWLYLSACSYAFQLFAFLIGYWWGHHWYWGFVGAEVSRIGFAVMLWFAFGSFSEWSEEDEEDDDEIS